MNKLARVIRHILVITILSISANAETEAIMSERASEFIQQNCMDCHNAKRKRGRVDLENTDLNLGKNLHTAERWQEILDAVNAGDMPPEDEPQPSPSDKTQFLSELSKNMVIARKIHAENGGKITIRRLNKREYANTIHAVTGIKPLVSHLPNDRVEHGYDTYGASLFMSSSQFEQYFTIAKNALKLAMTSGSPIKKQTLKIEGENSSQGLKGSTTRFDYYKDVYKRCDDFFASGSKDPSEFGFKKNVNMKSQVKIAERMIKFYQEHFDKKEVQTGLIIRAALGAGPSSVKTKPITTHPNEKITFRVRAAAYPVQDPRLNYLEFIATNSKDKISTRLGWRKITGTLENPQIIEIPVEIEHGQSLSFAVQGRTYQKGSVNDSAIYRGKGELVTPAGVWVDWIEIVSSGSHSGLTPQMANLFTPKPENLSEEEYATNIITKFSKNVFRTNKPEITYFNKLLDRFRTNRKLGMKLNEALIDPLAIMLSSPSFLYMMESEGSDEISNRELAVRLSYFLWNSPPDQELMDLAKKGQLTDPSILNKQVDRMLADPRVSFFINSFSHQLFGMDRLGLFPFDTRKHEGFDHAVQDSAREEIYQSLKHVIDNRLPIKNLLAPDYIVINDVMADHYKIKAVIGHQFRKVKVPPHSPRGGLLATTAVLAMGSDGINSSPVERGVWVLESILDMAPPPAPPNIPQLDRKQTGFISSRDLVKMHQDAPQCAQCHNDIDPVGFGLQQFDAAGLWREVETVGFKRKTKELKIDASGKIPNGATFNDFFGLKKEIYKKDQNFARVLTEALISYSLGRTYQFTDEDLASKIIKNTKPEGYPIDQIIKGIVCSESFLRK